MCVFNTRVHQSVAALFQILNCAVLMTDSKSKGRGWEVFNTGLRKRDGTSPEDGFSGLKLLSLPRDLLSVMFISILYR